MAQWSRNRAWEEALLEDAAREESARREYEESLAYDQAMFDGYALLESLKDIESAWSRETSYDGENWSKDNPAWGQCTVSAMIVQDRLGGEILRAKCSPGGSHYWNVLPDGMEIDITRKQFATFEKDRTFTMGEASIRPRNKIKDPNTLERYELLKKTISLAKEEQFFL